MKKYYLIAFLLFALVGWAGTFKFHVDEQTLQQVVEGGIYYITYDGTDIYRLHSSGILDLPLQSGCNVNLSGDQLNVVTGTDTKILFDVEVFDNNDDFGSNRFTAPVDGIYRSILATRIVNPGDNKRTQAVQYLNGGVVNLAQSDASASGASVDPSAISIYDFVLVAGDYLDAYVKHDAGVNKTLAGTYSTHWQVQKIY